MASNRRFAGGVLASTDHLLGLGAIGSQQFGSFLDKQHLKKFQLPSEQNVSDLHCIPEKLYVHFVVLLWVVNVHCYRKKVRKFVPEPKKIVLLSSAFPNSNFPVRTTTIFRFHSWPLHQF